MGSRTVVPVILSGGSGTRLWPLSRRVTPKQLLPLVTRRTLLQDTLLRARSLGAEVGAPIVICNEIHRFLVAEQLRAIDAGDGCVVLEPARRNTAPAVAVAALLVAREPGRGEDALLLVMPADHVILDTDAFVEAVRAAEEVAAAGYLVTFGVVPNRPDTGYGYILSGADQGGWSLLERFVEKPDLDTAKEYVRSGRYLWNSGMFLFSARTFLAELEAHAPGMVEACAEAVACTTVDRDFLRVGGAFLKSPSDSIDYAVMEKTGKAVVVPLEAGWSDVGSWPALHDVLDKDGDGNVLRGDVIAEACRDTYVLSNGRLIVAIGLEEHIVVETADAVLVTTHRHASKLKDVVEALGQQPGRDERT